MEQDKNKKTGKPECSICQEVFQDPKVLLCGHSFCLQCLLRMAPAGTKTLKCPLCQRVAYIPGGDVRKLPTNFGLRDAVEGNGPLGGPPDKDPKKPEGHLLRNIAIGGACAVGGLLGAAAIPFVILPAIGFGAGGIAAGSVAAGLMSSSAIASGGGVAAGSAVAVAQSIGAAGLAGSTYAAAAAGAGTVGASVSALVSKFKGKKGGGDGGENGRGDDGDIGGDSGQEGGGDGGQNSGGNGVDVAGEAKEEDGDVIDGDRDENQGANVADNGTDVGQLPDISGLAIDGGRDDQGANVDDNGTEVGQPSHTPGDDCCLNGEGESKVLIVERKDNSNV